MGVIKNLPDPRGRKSLPTTLSNTDDFPELWKTRKSRYWKGVKIKFWDVGKKRWTWPPTTATVGRASQRDIPSPPWSPNTVQARWILLTSPIKLSIVAIICYTIYYNAVVKKKKIWSEFSKEINFCKGKCARFRFESGEKNFFFSMGTHCGCRDWEKARGNRKTVENATKGFSVILEQRKTLLWKSVQKFFFLKKFYYFN